MFVIVYDPESNIEYLKRRMGPNEKLDARKFADKVAAEWFESEVEEPNGYIPNCSGDIRVEFRPRRDNELHIWSGQSFYFKRED